MRMRSEWVPFSSGALVTGVMAIMLAQLLNPGGPGATLSEQLVAAAESEGRWLAMSVLYFGGAAALVLGLPAVMSLFTSRRGRGIGMLGVMVFAVGCLGVAGLSALMLMFRALALSSIKREVVLHKSELTLVTMAVEERSLSLMLQLWVYLFLAGVLLIALGLLRARAAPRWVPGLLLAFLGMQLVLPFLHGTEARFGIATALLLLTAGFTGIATTATHPGRGLVPEGAPA